MLRQSAEVVAATHRLGSLACVAEEMLPTLAAATNASFLFLHYGSSCREARVVTWPPADDMLARYQEDYVVDCPFEPVKRASREWVLPITRRLPRKRLTSTAFYTDLLRPADLEHHLELRLEPAADASSVTQAGIIICRGKRASEFNDSDLATVAALRPSLAKAYRRAQAYDDAIDRIDALETILALGDPDALRIAVDADGREIHVQAPGADAWLLATLRDATHPLRRLARDVAAGARSFDPSGAMLARVVAPDGRSFVPDVGLVPRSFGRSPLAILSLAPVTPAMKNAWGLTRAEASVLREIVAGASNQEIGKRLCISPETVRTHLTRIYRKMGVSSRLAAAALARAA